MFLLFILSLLIEVLFALNHSETAKHRKLFSTTFVTYPHRKVFNGYLGSGDWYARNKRIFLDLDGMEVKFDKVQQRAYYDGIFVPYNENFQHFHIFSTEEAVQCLKGRKVFVTGDSYMKLFLIGLNEILTGYPSNEEFLTDNDRNAEFNHTLKSLSVLNKRQNVDVRFLFADCNQLDLQCFHRKFKETESWKEADALIMNTLVHHLNIHKSKANSQDLEIADNYMGQILKLFSLKSIKLTWVTAPSYSFHKGRLFQMARYDPKSYATVQTIELAKKFNIPLLDVYSMTDSCQWRNCTALGSHRARFVNRMKAQMMLNNLCNVDC